MALDWQHRLRPRLVAEVSKVYSDSRYQRLADHVSSYAGFGGGLNLAVTETPGYSSSFFSQLAGYGINDENHKFSYNEEVQLAGGSNSVWKLSSGSSISVMSQLVLMRAIPIFPSKRRRLTPQSGMAAPTWPRESP